MTITDSGIQGLWQAQIGKETTPLTAVTPTAILRAGETAHQDDSPIVYPEEMVGVVGGVGRRYISQTDGSVEVSDIEATFEQLPYLLNMGVKGVGGVADGGGSGYTRTYPMPYNAASYASADPYTYTVRVGDNEGVEQMNGAFATEVSLTGAATEAWMMSASLRGAPQGAASFQTGISIPTVEEIKFGNTALYINDVTTYPATTQITSAFIGFELTISNIWDAIWTGEGSSLEYTRIHPTSEPEITLSVTLLHSDQARTERTKRKTLVDRAVRIIGQGTNLASNGTYTKKTVIIDLLGSWMENEGTEEDNGNTALTFVLKNHYQTTAAARGQIIVVNEVANLP